MFKMAPPKTQSTNIATNRAATKPIVPVSRRTAITRATQKVSSVLIDGSQNVLQQIGKRKADGSPVRNGKDVKRSALGNVTNAVLNGIDESKKQCQTRAKNDILLKSDTQTTKKSILQSVGSENEQPNFLAPNHLPITRPTTKVLTRASARAVEQIKTAKLVATATDGVKKVNISTTIVKGKKKTEPQNATTQAKVIKTNSNGSNAGNNLTGRRISNEFDCENSHYMSALEDL